MNPLLWIVGAETVALIVLIFLMMYVFDDCAAAVLRAERLQQRVELLTRLLEGRPPAPVPELHCRVRADTSKFGRRIRGVESAIAAVFPRGDRPC